MFFILKVQKYFYTTHICLACFASSSCLRDYYAKIIPCYGLPFSWDWWNKKCKINYVLNSNSLYNFLVGSVSFLKLFFIKL